MTIQIKIEDAEVKRLLRRLKGASENMTPAMRAIAGVLRRATVKAFEKEQDPETGKKWQPLSPATLERRVVSADGELKILQDTGQLASSLTSEYGKDFAAAGPTKAQKYSAIHQFGGMAGRGRKVKIPARPFLGVGEDDMDEITNILLRHIDKALES